MICNVVDKDFYIIKVFNNYNNFDIYDHNEIKNFVQELFNQILKKYKLKGSIVFNIYIDNMYGMIIEIRKISDLIIDHLIDIKIKFNLNISFLYEVDYFYLLDNDISNQNVYYYNDKFYLEIINDMEEGKYFKLLDNCLIIYNEDINEIINKGIKFANINKIWYNCFGDRMREIIIGKKYRHFKNKLYKVLDIVYNSESNNDDELRKVVIYQALYGEGLKWARDYDMFNSEVDHEKYPDVEQKYRFEEVDD